MRRGIPASNINVTPTSFLTLFLSSPYTECSIWSASDVWKQETSDQTKLYQIFISMSGLGFSYYALSNIGYHSPTANFQSSTQRAHWTRLTSIADSVLSIVDANALTGSPYTTSLSM